MARSAAFDEPSDIVTLEDLGDDRFQGVGSCDDGVTTNDDHNHLHSLHGYFLRSGAAVALARFVHCLSHQGAVFTLDRT